MKNKSKHIDNAGFTLVEVLLAIAILAILCFPLLGYFSDAINTTTRGKQQQRAEMAGQSIIEELSSYTKYKSLDEAVAATGSVWSVDTEAEARASASPEPTATPDPANPGVPIAPSTIKYITRDLTIDGKKMTAKVKLDFNYQSTASGVIKYNNYEVPQLKALYSENSVVALDDGNSLDYAISEFFMREQNTVAPGTIRNTLDREGIISISYKDPGAKDVFVIKFNYMYSYNNPASSLPAEGRIYEAPYIVNTEILAEDFTSLYLLFKKSTDMTERFTVNIDPSILQQEQEKMNFYFICQDHKTEDTHGHKIQLTGAGSWINIFSNGHAISGTGNVDTKYIKDEKEERIANITVDIYKHGETTFDESTRIIRIQSSKGE